MWKHQISNGSSRAPDLDIFIVLCNVEDIFDQLNNFHLLKQHPVSWN
jgi:hypothetical protein